jgi:excinuclease ABC subunit B
VSYYNTYIPESYNEVNDRYTAKKSSVNDELDALRHLATRALVQHKDVVIVASVSCIYGMGMPTSYLDARLQWAVHETTFPTLDDIKAAMQSTVYTPTDENVDDLKLGQYQLVRSSTTGAILVLWPPYEAYPMRIDFIKSNTQLDYVISSISLGNSRGMQSVPDTVIFPAKHHLTDSPEQFEEALRRIQDELHTRASDLKADGKELEANRLLQRVSQDLKILRETGTCSGVENYSRHMALRDAGEAPDTLLDFFGTNNWLLMVDESHVTLPQLKAMYGGDRSRKERLVKHGFRLPSALDNRPLKDVEFWSRVSQCVFVSATPSKQELGLIQDMNEPIDMIIRPTYVCDPVIHVRPMKDQLTNLYDEIKLRTSRDEKTLVMTITKRDAEDLAAHLVSQGVSATYIHSGLNTHERSNALKALQCGEIDCLVGVNLLREGLDLPQVSLVAILNADSEGFLRSETALLQIIGRAARNTQGSAILYANRITDSMKRCIDVTSTRRQHQLDYNTKHGKVMASTQGSSILSIFDLLKDQIEAATLQREHVMLEVGSNSSPNLEHFDLSSSSLVLPRKEGRIDIETDHIPSKPGVYFWKDAHDNILYIGKAKSLRSRVKSYLSSKANHSTRIQVMLKKASSVEFILTPSERDALLLENKLIKHHQPLYNILLKDDESYPYICATIGDALPQLTIVPTRQEGSKHRYFGPYPKYTELHSILQAIEERCDLRSVRFQARYGDVSKEEYQHLFEKVMSEVFDKKSRLGQESLPAQRSQYDASNLFESKYNLSRDVVVVGQSESTNLVHVLQLRDGLVAGQFSYAFELNTEFHSDVDFGEVIQSVLEKKHYPSGAAHSSSGFSHFPNEILTQYAVDGKSLREVIRAAHNEWQPEEGKFKVHVREAATKGVRYESDKLALQCAMENASQAARDRSLASIQNVPITSVDGTAALELKELLSLNDPPKRIECFDVSHTQGEGTVASRVVFLDGQPAPDLSRRFNIQTVDGVDDYASLEEVLERRFKRVWINGKGGLVDKSDPWAKPDLVVVDGGKGQLSSAIKGMQKANVYPLFKDMDWQRNENLLIDCDGSILETEGIERHTFVPIVSLAKNLEEVFHLGSKPINTSQDSAALLLLRAIRDESHRFALNSHRKRRTKANGL